MSYRASVAGCRVGLQHRDTPGSRPQAASWPRQWGGQRRPPDPTVAGQGWTTNPRSELVTEGTTLRLPSGASAFHDFQPHAPAVRPESRAQVRVSVIVLDDPR